MGMKRDMISRSKHVRVDDQLSQHEIAAARKAIFEMGMSINSQFIDVTVSKKSLTVVRVSLGSRLSSVPLLMMELTECFLNTVLQIRFQPL